MIFVRSFGVIGLTVVASSVAMRGGRKGKGNRQGFGSRSRYLLLGVNVPLSFSLGIQDASSWRFVGWTCPAYLPSSVVAKPHPSRTGKSKNSKPRPRKKKSKPRRSFAQ